MRISKVAFHGCRWRPPTDTGPQVWFIHALSKVLIYHVLRKDGTVNDRLMSMVTKTVPAKKKPRNGVYTVDISIDPETQLWCRVFVPTWVDPGKKLPIMLYFHGGGFVLFCPDLKEYDSYCRHISKMCETIVVSVAYRHAPKHKHPTAYEDGLKALDWVRSQVSNPHEDFPFAVADFSKVFLAGDSAGGNIAHNVVVKAGSIDISPLSIVGLILVQPFFGGEERKPSELRYQHGRLCQLFEIDWYWKAFLPPGANRDHPSCNVCGPNAATFFPMTMPKMLVVVGGKDPLQDRQIEYAECMQSAGKECKLVIYPKAFHGFYVFRGVKSTNLLHDEIEDFVRPPTEDTKSVRGDRTGANTPRASSASFLDRILSW